MNTLNDNITSLDLIAKTNEIVSNNALSNFLPNGTILTVKTDGTGDFTNLQSAINYLTGKWSNGTVNIHIGNGTFNETYIKVSSYAYSIPFNIPLINIEGNGVSNSIIQWNRTTQGGTMEWYTGRVKFKNITFKNATYDSSKKYFGFYFIGPNTSAIFEDCNFENISYCIVSDRGAIVHIAGTINCTNGLGGAITSQISGKTVIDYETTINISNYEKGFVVMNSGEISLTSPILTFTSVTTKCNVTPNTITNNGIVRGISSF